MKRILLLFAITFCFTVLAQAQVAKTINVAAGGGLKATLTATELTTVTDLTVTGNIDARDFLTMRDNMTALSSVDLKDASIVYYHGQDGCGDWYTSQNYADMIPVMAFNNKVGLASIVLPTEITAIQSEAFYACGLKTISIPSGVTLIGDKAFESNSTLTAVTIPAKVTTLGEYCFSYCTALTSVTLPNSLKKWRSTVFITAKH